MDETVVDNPTVFRPGRPKSAYMHFGYGPHECLGREIALTYVVSMVRVCAGLKDLRRAPGPMGLCKYITVGKERVYLNDSWSYLTFDPTSKSALLLHCAFGAFIPLQFPISQLILIHFFSAWKLHFDGRGKGVYEKHRSVFDADYDLEVIKREIGRMHRERAQKAGERVL